jgi:hypothetical protein
MAGRAAGVSPVEGAVTFGLDRLVFLGIARGVRSRGDLRMGAMVDVVQQGAASKDAAPVRGMPVPWQLNFQFPFSSRAHGLFRFHNFLLGINIAICAIVLILILFVVWRFRGSRNSVPPRTKGPAVSSVRAFFWVIGSPSAPSAA